MLHVPPQVLPINRLDEQQLQDLVRLFQNEWWTKGRTLEDIRAMVQHSDLVTGFADTADGPLVTFARVLTDFVYKALILDVIVDFPYRKSGLGRALMNSIL